MRIYIAGPITGCDDYAERFRNAEVELKNLFPDSVRIVNPAYMVKTLESFSHREQVEYCFKLLGECDAIYLIEGWEESKGAQAEYGFATAKALKVMEQRCFGWIAADLSERTSVNTLEAAAGKKVEAVSQKKTIAKLHTKTCAVCGKEFTVSGRAAARATVCSEACRRENARLRNKKWREKEEAKSEPPKPKSKILEKAGIRPSRAFDIDAETRKVGKRYADIQKAETLAMVEKQREGQNE